MRMFETLETGKLVYFHKHMQETVDTTPTHNTHLCSTVRSQARNANHALDSSNHGLHLIFVRLKRIRHLVLHMSHPLLSLPPAVYHEHIIFQTL